MRTPSFDEGRGKPARNTTPMRVHIRRDLLEALETLGEQGCSLSTLINAAVVVALDHHEDITRDARGVSRKWHQTQS
jgi:hypothetical protein